MHFVGAPRGCIIASDGSRLGNSRGYEVTDTGPEWLLGVLDPARDIQDGAFDDTLAHVACS